MIRAMSVSCLPRIYTCATKSKQTAKSHLYKVSLVLILLCMREFWTGKKHSSLCRKGCQIACQEFTHAPQLNQNKMNSDKPSIDAVV